MKVQRNSLHRGSTATATATATTPATPTEVRCHSPERRTVCRVRHHPCRVGATESRGFYAHCSTARSAILRRKTVWQRIAIQSAYRLHQRRTRPAADRRREPTPVRPQLSARGPRRVDVDDEARSSVADVRIWHMAQATALAADGKEWRRRSVGAELRATSPRWRNDGCATDGVVPAAQRRAS